jgi:hypothetical protein
MKYLIQILSNPTFLQRWDELPQERKDTFGRTHLALSAELDAAGELLASGGLADPALAKRVSAPLSGATMVTDGPFAEAKEHLAGFLLVDVDSEQRALDIAARVPDAVWGLVEVRPLLDMSQWEG